MIHVLIVHSSTSRQQGGSVTFLRSLMRRLDSRAFRITVLFLEPGGLADDLAREGIATEVIDAGRLRNAIRAIQTIAAIRRLIVRRDIDLVFSNGAFEHIYAGSAAWLAGVPAMWYCHGCSEGRDAITSLASRVPAGLVVTHSQYTRSVLARFSRAPIQVVPLGIDMPNVNGARSAIRREIGIDADCPVVTMVGVFMEWKGQDVFIRAAARVREQVAARFVIVGDAPFSRHQSYAESLRRLVGESGLSDAVTFLGFRHDVAAVMAASDVIVHASLQPEPFGIVLLEAMASGRPVITTGLGGAAEIVEPGKTALVVAPGNPGALADACVTLLHDADLRNRIAAAGQRTVNQRFNLDGMVAGLTDCFRRMCHSQ